jgi:hypothetical protein
MAASGEIKVSANMWAVLADEEPGDSEFGQARDSRGRLRDFSKKKEAKSREAAEDRHQ